MISLDFEVAFIRVRIGSTGVVDVSVDDGDMSKSLCGNFVQLPADLKLKGRVAGGGAVKYVRPVNFDNFHHLKIDKQDQRTRGKNVSL